MVYGEIDSCIVINFKSLEIKKGVENWALNPSQHLSTTPSTKSEFNFDAHFSVSNPLKLDLQLNTSCVKLS